MHYFGSHHSGNRLFFSLQSSADIIYRSVKLAKKNINELSFIDYGGGMGTLYLLAGMAGFRQVCFNDYFPKWTAYSKLISDKLGIRIDGFIAGDIDAVIEYGESHNMRFDIIASRNVVEHIYSLPAFYTRLSRSGITGLCYSTTTANYHNPAMRLKHYWEHYKTEKNIFRKQREEYIRELVPGIDANDLHQLISITRGRAFEDFTAAVDLFRKKQHVPRLTSLGTNTCDCRTGMWAEHLIKKQDYAAIIEGTGLAFSYTPGFWDTHYKYAFVNLFTRCLNGLIRLLGKKGYWLSPFVNIVAIKK